MACWVSIFSIFSTENEYRIKTPLKFWIRLPRGSPRTTDTQWRHKSKISEKKGRCGRHNMLQPYLKIWEWEWIFRVWYVSTKIIKGAIKNGKFFVFKKLFLYNRNHLIFSAICFWYLISLYTIFKCNKMGTYCLMKLNLICVGSLDSRPFNLHLDLWKSRSWGTKVCFKP